MVIDEFSRLAPIYRVLAASWGQVVVAIVALLGIKLYTTMLNPAAFGVAMLVLGGMSLLDGMVGSAFAQTATVLLKDRTNSADRWRLGLGIAAVLLRPALPWAGAVWVIATVLAGMGIAHDWLLPLTLMVPVYVLAEPLRIVGQTVLLLDRRQGILSLWLATDAITTLALSSALAWTGLLGGGVLVIGALAARALTAGVFATLLFRRWFGDGIDIAAAHSIRGQALAFAAPVSAMAPIGWLSLYLDRYIVGVLVGPAAAGVLAALSGAIVRPYAIVSAALTNYFRPDVLDEAAGRPRGGRGALTRWIWTALGIGGVAFAFVALLGGWGVRFLLSFDQPVAWADRLLLVLAASQTIVLVRHAVDNRVLAQGRSGTLLSAQAVAVALGIPLIAAGAVLGGPIGAATGRAANEALLLVVTILLTSRRPVVTH